LEEKGVNPEVRRANVVLLTGPAGAGKTEAAKAWASTRPYPTAHVSIDEVRDFLKSGYANPEDGWTPNAVEQHDLARSIVADMARRYADRRVRFIVDDAIFPNWEALGEEPWRNALQGVTYTLLVLLPSFDAVRERNRLREGQRRLREETLQTIYNDMQGWRERDVAQIDNTGLTVAETATLIERNLHGTSDGPGRWVAC
jgi:chloramphenicol 3-O-phosphotransferase